MGWKEVKRKYERSAKAGGIDQNAGDMLARRIAAGLGGLKLADLYTAERTLGLNLDPDTTMLNRAIRVWQTAPSDVDYIRYRTIRACKMDAKGNPLPHPQERDALLNGGSESPTVLIGRLSDNKTAIALYPWFAIDASFISGIWRRPPFAVLAASECGGCWLVKQELQLFVSQFGPYQIPGLTCAL